MGEQNTSENRVSSIEKSLTDGQKKGPALAGDLKWKKISVDNELNSRLFDHWESVTDIRDCRKSPNFTFLLFTHLVKSTTYKS